MPSSIRLELLILLIFKSFAFLGGGKSLFVINFIILLVSGPDILNTATPDWPGAEDKAKIVIKTVYIDFNYLSIFKLDDYLDRIIS